MCHHTWPSSFFYVCLGQKSILCLKSVPDSDTNWEEIYEHGCCPQNPYNKLMELVSCRHCILFLGNSTALLRCRPNALGRSWLPVPVLMPHFASALAFPVIQSLTVVPTRPVNFGKFISFFCSFVFLFMSTWCGWVHIFECMQVHMHVYVNNPR